MRKKKTVNYWVSKDLRQGEPTIIGFKDLDENKNNCQIFFKKLFKRYQDQKFIFLQSHDYSVLQKTRQKTHT